MELAARSGLRQPDVSKIERGKIQQTTGIARLAAALDVSPLWLELGDGGAPDWSAPASKGRGVPVDQSMSYRPFDTPPTIKWEGLMAGDADLHQEFVLDVPDDALAPTTPRGTRLIFSRGVPPTFGQGVLVRDRSGGYYVRRYSQRAGGGWIAAASNPAYASLDPTAEAGLEVVAVAMWRAGGEV